MTSFDPYDPDKPWLAAETQVAHQLIERGGVMANETLSETRQKFEDAEKAAFDRIYSVLERQRVEPTWPQAAALAFQAGMKAGRLQGLEEAATMCDRWHGIYGDETAQRLADVIRKAIREKANG